MPVKNFVRTVTFPEVFHEPECKQVPLEGVDSLPAIAKATAATQAASITHEERVSLAELATANCDLVSVLYNTV